jgi:hypothetical protein
MIVDASTAKIATMTQVSTFIQTLTIISLRNLLKTKAKSRLMLFMRKKEIVLV